MSSEHDGKSENSGRECKRSGLRKWSVSITALTMGFVLALLTKLTPEFATIASITVGAFAAGNAMEHKR